MPQLMPLMWVCSVVMSIFTFLMLINMFYYKKFLMKSFLYEDKNINVFFKW